MLLWSGRFKDTVPPLSAVGVRVIREVPWSTALVYRVTCGSKAGVRPLLMDSALRLALLEAD